MLHGSAAIEANHERFVSRVAEWEVGCGLHESSGFAVCPSNDEERHVLMFWMVRWLNHCGMIRERSRRCSGYLSCSG